MAAEPMELLRGTLDLLILKTLAWGPSHGYAISRWIRDTTGDALTIEEGALYPALRRLEARTLVEASWQTTETGREAKVYHLLPAGRRHLAQELAGWKRYVVAMTRVIDARPRGGIA